MELYLDYLSVMGMLLLLKIAISIFQIKKVKYFLSIGIFFLLIKVYAQEFVLWVLELEPFFLT
jgi:hypothetical protein